MSLVLLVELLEVNAWQLGLFLHGSGDSEEDQWIHTVQVIVKYGCFCMVDFNLFVVDNASGVVERPFHLLAICSAVYSLMYSRGICGALLKDVLGNSVKVWPVQGSQLFDWSFDGKAKIWKLSLLRSILFFCDKLPFSILFVEV